MLKSLNVSNFALIRSMSFLPGAGFNVITGETGAGKSIMLGALGLVLGNRADSSSLLNVEEKCIVEAIFISDAPTVKEFLHHNNLDEGSEIILRRELSPNGKSRAFINDTPVTLQELKVLGSLLIEIHTQNTMVFIKDADLQLALIDDFGVDSKSLKQMDDQWKALKEKEKSLAALREMVRKSQLEKDYLQFQFDELESIKPTAGEDQKLEERIQWLSHVAEISDNTQKVQHVFMESENSVYHILNSAKALLKSIAPYNSAIQEYLQKTEALMLEVKDISSGLYSISDKAETQPEELENLNSRLAGLQQLMRKHQVDNSSALAILHAELEQKLHAANHATENMSELEKEVALLRAEFLTTAKVLHEERILAGKQLCAEMPILMRKLGMPRAQIDIEFVFDETALSHKGCTTARILFNADGKAILPLDKIASGGETSRLSFCFKTLLAHKKSLPTVVFDEADTGVSGEVALNFGELMQNMGLQQQIITITHLPQVAAFGSSHFEVYKELISGKASTALRVLTEQERVGNIASMLSGKDPGEAALATAKELLGLP